MKQVSFSDRQIVVGNHNKIAPDVPEHFIDPLDLVTVYKEELRKGF